MTYALLGDLEVRAGHERRARALLPAGAGAQPTRRRAAEAEPGGVRPDEDLHAAAQVGRVRLARAARGESAGGGGPRGDRGPPGARATCRAEDSTASVCVSAAPPAWVAGSLPFPAHRLAFLRRFVRRAAADYGPTSSMPTTRRCWLRAARRAAHRGEARLRLARAGHRRALPRAAPGRASSACRAAVVAACAAVITVSDGIARNGCRTLYGLRSARPWCATVRPMARAGPGGLRARLGIGDAPLVLHQGAPAPGRGCEQLIVRSRTSRRPTWCSSATRGRATRAASSGLRPRRGRRRSRVHFVPSVPIGSCSRIRREADVGVSLLEDTCENHRLALPNKVFEYVAAGCRWWSAACRSCSDLWTTTQSDGPCHPTSHRRSRPAFDQHLQAERIRHCTTGFVPRRPSFNGGMGGTGGSSGSTIEWARPMTQGLVELCVHHLDSVGLYRCGFGRILTSRSLATIRWRTRCTRAVSLPYIARRETHGFSKSSGSRRATG